MPDGALGPTMDALGRIHAEAAALEDLARGLTASVRLLEEQLSGRLDGPEGAVPRSAQAPSPAAIEQDTLFEPPERSKNIEGARLVALNMALNGDSRDATSRYLGEHFDVPDRDGLLDEVYAVAGV